MQASIPSADRETRLIALLAASCLFFSLIEYLIPKPLPFMRLGLANLPILFSLNLLQPRKIVLLIVLKVLGQGLVNGTLFSYIFLFSAAGSFSSGMVMLLLFRLLKTRVSMLGLCLAGALTSNLIQLTMARYIIFGKSALLIGPPFLAIGTISAVILGVFAERFLAESRWYREKLDQAGKQ